MDELYWGIYVMSRARSSSSVNYMMLDIKIEKHVGAYFEPASHSKTILWRSMANFIHSTSTDVLNAFHWIRHFSFSVTAYCSTFRARIHSMYSFAVCWLRYLFGLEVVRACSSWPRSLPLYQCLPLRWTTPPDPRKRNTLYTKRCDITNVCTIL